MKLLNLHIENFGKLHCFDLPLNSGLNVLYQKNGWGKSTLAVFIKAMLYGLPASTKRSLDENERKKYTPWQGGAFGGSLDFETEKGTFRAERFFGAKESADSFALFDLKTHSPSSAYSAALGEELFGIDADGFERSTYLSQRIYTFGKENSSISAKLGNLLDDVGDIGSFDVAMEALEKRRRYYILTGNRGAIAEMEQARMEKQSERERCMRVREAMEAQEEELASCTLQIQTLQKNITEIRAQQKKASLARERMALLEHKNSLLAELAELERQKKQNDLFFNGAVPSAEELEAARSLYREIRNTRVRLDTLCEASPNAKTLARLQKQYSEADCSPESLNSLEKDTRALQQLQIQSNTLKTLNGRVALSGRFPNGAPSVSQLEQAREQLEQADRLQQALQAAPSAAKKAFPVLPVSVASILSGILLAIFSRIQTLSAILSAVFGIVGGVLAAGGVAFLCTALFKKAKAKREAQKCALQKQEWENQRKQALQSVLRLLATYGMPSDQNPAHALAELSALAAQYRESEQSRAHIAEELNTLEKQRQVLLSRLRTALRPFGADTAQKEDFRAEIEQIRRDMTFMEQLEATEAKRWQERKIAENMLQNQKEQLLPFLRRYDPLGKLHAGECLDRVNERLAERARLTGLYAAKEAELKAFIAEKNLDCNDTVQEAASFESLSEQERTVQEQLEALQKRHTLLKSSIDRLSDDADRIGELEAELAKMNLRIEEAKANAATIANTEKFLEEAKAALSTRYLDSMQKSFCASLAQLTGEAHPEALLDASFEVRLREAGKTHTVESFSRGSRDVIQFCVRLSLTDALYKEGEKPFLLLDDPFVNLDDEHLSAVRALLDTLAKRYQILYLVCHRDRL